MGQREGLDFSNHNNNPIEPSRQTNKKSMANNGTLFGLSDSMGSHSINISAEHQQPKRNFPSFFTRLGDYNVYNILPVHKKMAALAIKISVILANLMGLSLWIYWLTIDFEGIKVFISSIGVFCWGTMKLYEKYLDLKDKRRKDKTNGDNFKNHNHNGKE